MPLISVLLVAIGVFTLYLAVALRSETERRERVPLQWFYLGSALWSVAYGVQLAQETVAGQVVWTKVQFLAVGIIPAAWVLFAALYTDRIDHLRPRYVLALAIQPLASILLVVWNPDALVLGDATLVLTASFAYLQTDFGPWFYLTAIYSYVLVGVGVWFLVDIVRTRHGPYRPQAAILALAGVAPTLGSILWVATPIIVDPTPFAFFISGVALYVAVIRYRFGELVPIARRSVVDAIEDVVLVVDDSDAILDVNAAGAAVLQGEREAVIGEPVEAVLPEIVPIDSIENGADITLADRVFDARVSELERDESAIGRAVILRDVTTRSAYERRIEHKNEQLEHLLSILSHDIQNPLQVGGGQLALAREREEYDRLERVAAAFARIEAIIEDTLAWAEQGGTVAETTAVSLSSVASTCWESVLTESATLSVTGTATIEADEARLRHLLENLFRNSVEHGTPAATETDGGVDGEDGVTIEIGPIEDRGFFVQDDGPGIDPARRESIFETGYTTSDDGTGFGLSIVAQVAAAHDWTVEVTESPTGGARFEILGVEMRA